MIEPVPSSIFAVPAAVDLPALLARLGDGYCSAELEPEQLREEYLDTFEWSLYQEGMALARSGRRYRLYSAAGVLLGEGRGPRKKRPFWRDFGDGPLRDELARVSDIRALCPKVRLTGERRFFQVLNEDRKTVLRLRLEKAVCMADGRAAAESVHLHLDGIRGYDREFADLERLLHGEGLAAMPPESHFLAPLLTGAGVSVDTQGAKTAITLAPESTLREGLRQVGLAVLADIERNLPGTIDDIDTEFLHDLRISLRRTRSLISIFKKNFANDEGRHFRAEFRWITQATGDVRDSDVYLLSEDDYREMLPAALHPGLAGFVRGMREFRSKAFRVMRKNLKSARFARLLARWRHYLEHLPEAAGNEALCREFAARAVRKRFRRLIAQGQELTPESPPTALHALRIEAKKLRYLLEFFHSLFPAEEVGLLIRHMKKLQNNLGDFNDLSVQQAMLGTFRSPGRNQEPQPSLAIAAALGGLVTRLHERQLQVRSEFEATFAEFACPENSELLRSIVRAAGGKANTEGAGERR